MHAKHTNHYNYFFWETILKRRGKIGTKVYEIVTPRPNGLGVSQYKNTRAKKRGI